MNALQLERPVNIKEASASAVPDKDIFWHCKIFVALTQNGTVQTNKERIESKPNQTTAANKKMLENKIEMKIQ